MTVLPNRERYKLRCYGEDKIVRLKLVCSESEFAVEGRHVSSYFQFCNKEKKKNKYNMKDFFGLMVWKDRKENSDIQIQSIEIVLIFGTTLADMFF